MKPTKEEVIAEAQVAFDYLIKELPVGWKFAGFKVVNNHALKSRADMNAGEDGGRSFTLVYSMSELDADWKRRVWTRTAHELTHVRLYDIEDIDKLNESYCEISESLVNALYNSRSPQQT